MHELDAVRKNQRLDMRVKSSRGPRWYSCARTSIGTIPFRHMEVREMFRLIMKSILLAVILPLITNAARIAAARGSEHEQDRLCAVVGEAGVGESGESSQLHHQITLGQEGVVVVERSDSNLCEDTDAVAVLLINGRPANSGRLAAGEGVQASETAWEFKPPPTSSHLFGPGTWFDGETADMYVVCHRYQRTSSLARTARTRSCCHESLKSVSTGGDTIRHRSYTSCSLLRPSSGQLMILGPCR